MLRIREFLTDWFFYGMGLGCFALIIYLLVLGWQGEHPQPKQHWSQGPQDPIPTY